ncbi:MAG: hypothetical protein JKY31_01685 [Rhodobacteraceae bacterium]|nr:hypothetical protein [Paracoccaceae bacterium]
MNHTFFIGDISENPTYDYRVYGNRTADVSLHDDVFAYIHDSINWVVSFNPAIRMAPHTGLFLTGVTVLKSSGARNLFEISKAWSSLFKQSPSKLRLTGGFRHIEGDSNTAGWYEKLVFDRGNIIEDFDLLASLCLEVAESSDTAFVMHYGL